MPSTTAFASAPASRPPASVHPPAAIPARHGERSAPGTARTANRRAGGPRGKKPSAAADHEILFQQYFQSVGPRTYAAQVKRANNGNHYLVLTEGQRDKASGELRKTRLYVFSEDFTELFRLMKSMAEFIKANPVPAEVKQKRQRYWTKHGREGAPAKA